MLSGLQLKQLIAGVKVIIYQDLNRVNHIDEILPQAGLIILYPSMERGKINHSLGHWVCLFKKGNKIIYFDPYGTKIDQCLIDFETLNYFRDGEKFMLSQLLADSDYDVDFNNYQLQNGFKKGSKEIDTCGYWCVARLRLKNLDTDQFFEIFSRENNPGDMDKLIIDFVKNPRKFKI
jgi:hypothetical protein